MQMKEDYRNKYYLNNEERRKSYVIVLKKIHFNQRQNK